MTQLIDALSARTRFGELMQRAVQENIRFLVSRRGKPAVVIMSVDDYLKNVLKKPTLLTEIQQKGSAPGFKEKLADEIKAENNQNEEGEELANE